jgi:hypothetical protein
MFSNNPFLSYSFIMSQIILGFVINKYCYKELNKLSSMTTLVLLPLAPILALVLYSLTRVKNKDYYMCFIFIPALLPTMFIMKMIGAPVIVFSVMITVIVYAFNYKQDGPISVVIGIIICYLCKDMENPISFIISGNILGSYVSSRVLKLTTNRFKTSKESYDNKGVLTTVIGGFLEAAFISPPSDVISNNKDMMNGLADILCIINLLFNDSVRGTTTVIVTNWMSAIIFIAIITITYFYNEDLKYIDECDKVWPPIYSNDIKDVTNLELGLVVGSLIACNHLIDYMLIAKLVIIIGLFMFVRVKVVTSLFFSTNLLF